MHRHRVSLRLICCVNIYSFVNLLVHFVIEINRCQRTRKPTVEHREDEDVVVVRATKCLPTACCVSQGTCFCRAGERSYASFLFSKIDWF
jgi:hypothetical protein